MKNLLLLLLTGTIITLSLGCTNQSIPEKVDVKKEIDIEKKSPEDFEDKDVIENITYELSEKTFEDKEKNIVINYPEITGYKGELLQGYMNQSLDNIINIYGSSESYSQISIGYEVTRMDNDILSVVFRGRGKFEGERDINILKSINLDIGNSTNEINYANLLNNDSELRELLDEKVIELKLADYFEAEGINLYFKDNKIVFYYMPLDDSVTNFIEIPIIIDEIKELLNTDFGEMPAS